MNQNGRCPVMTTVDSYLNCMTDKCAWWDGEKDTCIVFAIHEGIQKITSDEIYDLSDVAS